MRQRIHLNINTGSDNLLLHLHIARTPIEKSFKGVNVTILLNHNAIEGDAGDCQLTRQLRKHHILAPRHRAIRTTIESLDLETLLLRKIHLLSMEALQVRHLTLQLRQRDQGIDLIGEQNRFLLINTLLVGTHLDEEIRSGDMTASISQLGLIILLALLTGRSRIARMTL